MPTANQALKVEAGRLVLQREFWRLVAVERPDEHGVLRTDYVIEVTDARNYDALGVQRWHELTGKSAMGDWVRAARWLMDEVLRQAGEDPRAED